jgi:myosin heavy subunit
MAAAAGAECDKVAELMQRLEDERRKNAQYERQIKEMRNQMGVQQSQIEAEAESITNKLMQRIKEIEKEKALLRQQVEAEERRMKSEKVELEQKLQQSANHLSRLKHEKEVIVRQVEQEEEFLTNTLQQKLSKVLAEKVEIENDLEQEQEYISNRLQKQVKETQLEKQEMERRLEDEQAKVAAMEDEKRKLTSQLQSLQVTVELEEERISNRLGKTVEVIKAEKQALILELEREKAAAAAIRMEHEQQRQELKKLQGSNFVMQQRISREASKLEGMQREKSYIAQRLEAEWEKHFNVMIRDKSRDMFGPFGARTSSLEEWGLPEIEDQIFPDQDDVGDVVGEMAPRIFQKRRSHKWESQSLPSFSPRLSPYPSPPTTPVSSRSRSPGMRSRDFSPARSVGLSSSNDSSRAQSPSARSARSERSATSSIGSSAATMGAAAVGGGGGNRGSHSFSESRGKGAFSAMGPPSRAPFPPPPMQLHGALTRSPSNSKSQR